MWALVTTLTLCAAGRGPLVMPGVTTRVENSLFNYDAFPELPELHPGGRVTIAQFNASRGGRINLMHLVVSGLGCGNPSGCPTQRLEIQRRVALSITYDENPFPSVVVPIGDFFVDHGPDCFERNALGLLEPCRPSRSRDPTARNSTTGKQFETPVVAKRDSDSWWSYIEMPYRTAIKVELVSRANVTIGGYAWVQHEDSPFDASSDGYFHAVFSSNPSLRFPLDTVPILNGGSVAGPGSLIGYAMVFTATAAPPVFAGDFNYVCEGNWEFFLDNATALRGNDSSVDIAQAGYQASDGLVTFLGTEDAFGYSGGWSGESTGYYSGTPLWFQQGSRHALSTYRFFPERPLRFSKQLRGQVNWAFDVQRNPVFHTGSPVWRACPAGVGCLMSYDVITYMYLATPRNASAVHIPWPILDLLKES
jgi:hypothetical protein